MKEYITRLQKDLNDYQGTYSDYSEEGAYLLSFVVKRILEDMRNDQKTRDIIEQAKRETK